MTLVTRIETEMSASLDADERRALRDMRRAMWCPLPDPGGYADQLPLAVVEALLAATRCAEGYRLPEPVVRDLDLRARGLVDCQTGKPILTGFATKVRRLLIEAGA